MKYIYLFLLPLVQGFDLEGSISPNPQNFLDKYALNKLYESCFGTDNIFEMKMRIHDATNMCLDKRSLFDTLSGSQNDIQNERNKPGWINRSPYLNQYVQSLTTGAKTDSQNRRPKPRPKFTPKKRPSYSNKVPIMKNPVYQEFYNPYGNLAGGPVYGPLRGKRQLLQDSLKRSQESKLEKIQGLQVEILNRLSNVTCILIEMGILDADKRVNVVELKRQYSQMDLDEKMKSDLTRGIETCAAYSSCLPLDEFADTPIGKDVAPAILFVNCFKGKKMEACIKKDIRERLVDFIKNDDSSNEMQEMLARTGSGNNLLTVPEDQNDMENFVFALLYEDEPKSLI